MKLGVRVPMVRWSFWRLVLGAHRLNHTGQVGDGRERAVVDYVCDHARRDDIDDVLRTFDWYAYHKSLLINVGDVKGELLDAAVRRADPRVVLELGTYCGYSALRIARAAPSAHVYSIELSADNAELARRIWRHAGVSDRVTCLQGTMNDDDTLRRLGAAIGESGDGTVDFVFIDHDKSAYVGDLQTIEASGWLRPGSIVLADNVGYPGAPRYRHYMHRNEGVQWRTRTHHAHAEYQTLIPDLVLESEFLGV
ncbi:O-methyltransferase [Mycolicibacterium moriokaense]|nr:O-methyltransferase [Mycolicibacterium moriokaense]